MYLDPSDLPSGEETAPGVLRQMSMMACALWASPVRNTLFVLGGAIFAVIVATAYGQIRLNRWNRLFYVTRWRIAIFRAS